MQKKSIPYNRYKKRTNTCLHISEVHHAQFCIEMFGNYF